MCFCVLVFTSTSRGCWLFLYSTTSFVLNIFCTLWFGLLTCRRILIFFAIIFYIFRVCVFGIYIFRYIGFCFLYVYPVHQCVVFLVSCVLVLAVSPEKKEAVCYRNLVCCFEYFFLSMLLIFVMYNHRQKSACYISQQ